MLRPHPPAERVAIAGGGVAAVETLLALRYGAGGAAFDVSVLAPAEELVYRPLSLGGPLEPPPVRRYRLAEICAELGATLVRGELAAVDAQERAVVTADGTRLPYDALAIATGARSAPALPGAVTAGEDPDGVAEVVRDLERGAARQVAFVVPPGGAWTLPLYELALLTARRAADAGVAEVALTVVTPEASPLEIFRGAGSAEVARLLAQAGVTVLTRTCADAWDGRTVTVRAGGRGVPADRVVALPRLSGPAPGGVQCDGDGYVRVDERGRVPGLTGVWAVGDATTFPIRQAGVAAQQADAVAAAIAGRDDGPSRRPQLRAILRTGGEPLYLNTTISGGESAASTVSRDCPWWPPHKIAARHLAPYLADRAPLARVG